jgi:ribose/xylose/arabinose/galactoside ABC-type transport system permease subunit
MKRRKLMNWLEIVILSMLSALPNWIKNRTLVSSIKELIIVFISLILLKFLFAYIKLPDIPEKFKGMIFGGIIILATVVITIRAFKQSEK